MQDRGTRTKEVLITALYAADSDAELKRKLPVDVEDVWASRSWAPTEQVFRSVKTALEYTHGVIPHKPSDHSVVDSLVGTILSQNTTDVNSSRCFQLLKVKIALASKKRTSRSGPNSVAGPLYFSLHLAKVQRLGGTPGRRR
mmetsp:Transcript_15970/g.65679  ORF Transcript_15970/g.65679 Transcript_15970/m.65679 type:complete len:142 (-) Transcript_15970:671-1096(-)